MVSLRGICKVNLPAPLHHQQGPETEATSLSYQPNTQILFSGPMVVVGTAGQKYPL